MGNTSFRRGLLPKNGPVKYIQNIAVVERIFVIVLLVDIFLFIHLVVLPIRLWFPVWPSPVKVKNYVYFYPIPAHSYIKIGNKL